MNSALWRMIAGFMVLAAAPSQPVFGQNSTAAKVAQTGDVCVRGAEGSTVPEPKDLRSQNGVLRVELTFRSEIDAKGQMRFCYIDKDGAQSPNLRLHPGDTLILTLKNEALPEASTHAAMNHPMQSVAKVESGMGSAPDPCAGGTMTPTSTNLHFHGLVIPPVCHQDETIKTLVPASAPPFEYRFQIPTDATPGLYWYHPHPHGFSKAQVLGGASGALIVEGIERATKKVAGLRERVFIIRDQDLQNPNAAPSTTESVVPKIHLDRDGDVMNMGTGTGKPAKDLSINYVPVPYPDYPPASIQMRPGETQLWRVLNASAITYLNLQMLFDRKAQKLEVVALDGVPYNQNGDSDTPLFRNHLGIPPAGRVEFLVKAPPEGVSAVFVCRTVNTGPGGENDPNRPVANVTVSADAPEPISILASNPEPLSRPAIPWLGTVTPVHTRKLYFSEKPDDPSDPNSRTTFFVTVDGQTPAPFDPHSDVPAIIVKQGDVEDWTIENRSNELHAFHIHQIHFLLMKWNGFTVNEPYLRDTVDVPFYDGKSIEYPSVTLRMDFRDPKIVGTFLYHCHLLEHEDNGMMGLIRVEPAETNDPSKSGLNTSPKLK